ncbi:putative protein [Vanrija pseudolonga]|uniref:Purtative protein n=1 Tax=Vanrija pseudolonga TaxID=143232 RepID=A0AAF1BF21_9TREE|nr:purtative protein [Vanrija pseudolonga]
MTTVPTASGLSYLVISGGTGANSFASAFGRAPAFVLPVSDDGGSSAEILRCFGGPSIGDIRSRLIRLIPLPPKGQEESEADVERRAIYNLMAHRFPADAPESVVRERWEEIVEGRGELWNGVGEDKKECIRAFLVHFQTLCLRRAHKRFSFRNFSLGNGFLTGARDLFSNLPSAIFLFKSVGGVNEGAQVIPVINTNRKYLNKTITIAVQLENQSTIVGQCNISHPTPSSNPLLRHNAGGVPVVPVPINGGARRHGTRRDSRTFDTAESALATPERGTTPLLPGEEREDSGGNLAYTKGMKEVPLESRIERLFYINLYGQEIFPEPNTDFYNALDKRDVLVYSCGSLWTSIVPCIALRGLGTSIAQSKSLKAKVVLLNSVNDRETGDYTAMDYIDTIANMLRHYDVPVPLRASFGEGVPWETRSFITHVAYLEGGKVPVDEKAIRERGINVIRIPAAIHQTPEGKTPLFKSSTVSWAMDRVVEDIGH